MRGARAGGDGAPSLVVTEADAQRSITDALRWRGYVVLTTDRHRKRCHSCGAYSGGGDGVARGVPDLLVFDPRLKFGGGASKWWALEVKRPGGGRLSAAQEELVRIGAVTVVRTADEALRAVGVEEEGLTDAR